jgi:hypothetical protein
MSHRPDSECLQVKRGRRLAVMGGPEIEQKRSAREVATSPRYRDLGRDEIRARLLKKL